ncbi:MAG TPA: O-antigen ligase family protein, partial [Longimicrobiales bacterium]|nr:O-antigen ligase family protein [Longimicrobiales bacterium]
MRSPPAAAPVAARNRRPPEKADSGSVFSAFHGVEWSLGYVSLLLWVVVITTYALPIGDLVMGGALIGLLFEKRMRVPGFLACFGAFFVWSLMGLAGTAYPAVVREEIITLGKIWLIGLVAVNMLSTPKRLRLLLFVFLVCFALYPARGALFNYFLAGYALFGRALWNYIYANPNDLAALALLQLSTAVGLYVTERSRLYKLGAIASSAVLTLLIVLTQSRAGFIGLVSFGVLFLVGHRKKGQAVAGLIVVAAVAIMFAPSSAWERFAGLRFMGSTETIAQMDEEGSAEQRFEIWKTAGHIIADHPLFGVGWGAYPEANARYAPVNDPSSVNLGARDTHSTYLNVLAVTGFPGLAFFLAMIGMVLLQAQRARRAIQAVAPERADQIYYAQLGLIGFLVAGIFGSYAKLTFLYLQLVIVWAMSELHVRTYLHGAG